MWRKQVIEVRTEVLSLNAIGRARTSFTKDNNATFPSEKWQNEAFREVYILRIREKKLKSNLVLVNTYLS